VLADRRYFPGSLIGDSAGGCLCLALVAEKVSEDCATGYRTGQAAPESALEMRVMARRKVRSVFHDVYPADQAAEMEMRSQLLSGLRRWLTESGMTQVEAAKVLGVTQARMSDLKRGKISRFSLDLLVRLAARAGLRPKLKLAALKARCYKPFVKRSGRSSAMRWQRIPL